MSTSPLAVWLSQLENAITNNTLVKVTLHKPIAAAEDVKSIDIKPILVKRELKLSFTYHHTTKDIVKNHLPAEALPMIQKGLHQSFRAALLCTTQGDARLAKSASSFILTQHPASHSTPPSLSHDHPKNHLLSPTQTYLSALGITNAQGHVRKDAQHKFRQLNSYLEAINPLIKQLPSQPHLKVIDMGTGKGYLTFALHDHLTNTLGLKAQVIGVEQRPELVTLCNKIVSQHNLAGLSFVQGTINSYSCTGADVVIALHACNTATDDAICQAIQAQASLIVVAPCCHQEIRPQLNQIITSRHPLYPLLQHPTYAERMADMLTDTLRAHLLTMQGYSTKVFEFIGGEHTPKNVMLTATKTKPPTATTLAQLQATYTNLTTQFGIKKMTLNERLISSPTPPIR